MRYIMDKSNKGLTELILLSREGDVEALTQLWNRVYPELKKIASKQLRGERKDHTLQTTALVNEAFLRFKSGAYGVQDSKHYFAIVAKVMRQILVDHARARNSEKRDSNSKEDYYAEIAVPEESLGTNFIELDLALNRLASVDSRLAQVVELKYFGGLSVEEIATQLEISKTSVKRDWTAAKIWLLRELTRKAA